MMSGMGRPLRFDSPGTWHHVMNRVGGRRIVFRSDADRECFLALVAEMGDRFGVEVHAFCLLGNHYHLLVRSTDGRLSEAMKWLGSQFTRRVNASRGVDGAIFRGRFHSVLVKRDGHLVWLFRYVNANPLDLGWTGPLAEYPWSGLATMLGRTSQFDWMRTDFGCSLFGTTHRLEEFVEASRNSVAVPKTLALPAECDTFSLIVDSVEVASGPGPEVHSTADCRVAATIIALDVCKMEPGAIPTITHLDDRAGRAYIDRARRRVCDAYGLQTLVARSVDAMTTASSGV